MVFTWCGDEFRPNPKCTVCGKMLANEAMVRSKLKWPFSIEHDHDKRSTSFLKSFSCRPSSRGQLVGGRNGQRNETSHNRRDSLCSSCKNNVCEWGTRTMKAMFFCRATRWVDVLPTSDNTSLWYNYGMKYICFPGRRVHTYWKKAQIHTAFARFIEDKNYRTVLVLEGNRKNNNRKGCL
jgi:hypothetical protein